MKPVVQMDRTGCGIAAAAAIAGVSYADAKATAASVGVSPRIPACGPPLVLSAARTRPFTRWDALPDCALLAIKWHVEEGRPHWHWVVFHRAAGAARVLDSRRGLAHSMRRDFGRMKPKWYLTMSRIRGT